MSFRCKAAVTGLIALCALVYLFRPPIAQAAEGLPQVQCPQALPVESLPAETKSSWARAHEFATGAGVKVAVINTGIYPHPYLNLSTFIYSISVRCTISTPAFSRNKIPSLSL